MHSRSSNSCLKQLFPKHSNVTCPSSKMKGVLWMLQLCLWKNVSKKNKTLPVFQAHWTVFSEKCNCAYGGKKVCILFTNDYIHPCGYSRTFCTKIQENIQTMLIRYLTYLACWPLISCNAKVPSCNKLNWKGIKANSVQLAEGRGVVTTCQQRRQNRYPGKYRDSNCFEGSWFIRSFEYGMHDAKLWGILWDVWILCRFSHQGRIDFKDLREEVNSNFLSVIFSFYFLS